MTEADVLFDSIGGFGHYQKRQFFIMCLMGVFSMDLLYFNFISYSPDHWCKAFPQNGKRNLSADDLKNRSIPWDVKNNRYSQCHIYDEFQDHSATNGTLSQRNGADIVTCTEWEFDISVFSETTVTKWQLVCNRKWMVDLLPTIQSFGILVGSAVSGISADRFGRWKTIVIFMIIKLLSWILSLLSPLFSVLLFARFMVGLGGVGTYNTGFIIALETTQPKHRTWMGVILSLTFSIGSMILGGFSYLVRDWRMIQLLGVVPCAVFTLLTIFFVYESPRWLLQRGHVKKGIEILRKIGKLNGRPFQESVDTVLNYQLNLKPLETKESPKKLFSTPTVRKYTFVCLMAWLSVTLIFYALSLNAKSLSGDIFLNFFLLAAVEVPANLLALVCLRSKILGRRLTHVAAFLLAGVACFVSVPLLLVFGKSYATTGLAILGKAGASAAFTGIFIYTAELYPTEIRSSAMGVMSLVGRFGGVLAPYVGGSMEQTWPPLPSLIFGVTGTLSGLLILLLPETRGRVLKDTAQEIEVVKEGSLESTDSATYC